MQKLLTKTKLNPEQEIFCQLFASERECLGNGTESYAEAYGIDLTEKGGYSVAAVGANRLLKNLQISSRISELLDLKVGDLIADKELIYTIVQKSDLRAKVEAIKEYNKLKRRIVDNPLIDSRTLVVNISKEIADKNNINVSNPVSVDNS